VLSHDPTPTHSGDSQRRCTPTSPSLGAASFLVPQTGRRMHPHPDSGYFSVYTKNLKWRATQVVLGVALNSANHPNPGDAAVELEWLLGVACQRTGEAEATGGDWGGGGTGALLRDAVIRARGVHSIRLASLKHDRSGE
jgi:hypothetical protein